MKSSHTSQRGFTLIEMIVSIGIFTIVLFIATSAFLSVVNADRRSYATRVAVDNLTVALEDMSRRIKTGTTYEYGSVENKFSFKDQDNTTSMYRLDSTTKKIMRTVGAGAELPATPDDIEITNLSFEVGGVTGGDNEQPYVRIRITGKPTQGMVDLPFTIQTMITQRAYDF